MTALTRRTDRPRRAGFMILLWALLALLGLACSAGGGSTNNSNRGVATTTKSAATTPTRTPIPPPVIAGVYYGYVTQNAFLHTGFPLRIQIAQSAGSLSGALQIRESLSRCSGSIASNGAFTLREDHPTGDAFYLSGAPHGVGRLSGTWGVAGHEPGVWDGYTSIAGRYSGGFAHSGSSDLFPMNMTVTQSGATLGGTTTEVSLNSNNSGSFAADGTFTVVETFYGGVTYLHGSVVGPGRLAGAWDVGGGTLGTWAVHQT